MAAEVNSIAKLLRGKAGKKEAPSEMVTMDLLGGCGGGGREDEVVDLEVKVPAGWERRLDLASGKTFLTPRNQGAQTGHQDLNLPPPATASAAVCTLDMVRSALEFATVRQSAASPATSSSSSASTSSSSSVGKRHRSPPGNPAMRAAACPNCLTYVLFSEADPRCPRCSVTVPPQVGQTIRPATADGNVGKKPKIDLNAAADETDRVNRGQNRKENLEKSYQPIYLLISFRIFRINKLHRRIKSDWGHMEVGLLFICFFYSCTN